jgi:hypothetical protein
MELGVTLFGYLIFGVWILFVICILAIGYSPDAADAAGVAD